MIHNTLELKRIDRQLDVITTISVNSFLNLSSRRLGLLLPLYITPIRHLPPFLLFNCPVSHGTPPFSFLLRSQLSSVTWHTAMFLPSSFSTFICHMAHRHVPFFFVLTAELTVIKHFLPPLAFSSICLLESRDSLITQ